MTEVANMRPAVRPARPFFRPDPAPSGRAGHPKPSNGAAVDAPHRSKPGKAKLKDAIDRTKKLLGHARRLSRAASCRPPTPARSRWRCGRCWGARPVDAVAWESFGEDWVTDTVKQLKIKDCAHLQGRPTASLPDLEPGRSRARRRCSLWNGTTIGRARARTATGSAPTAKASPSAMRPRAAFAHGSAWDKLDVVTFSWQKVLGGEAAHGMLILSPARRRAAESYTPPWPLPKIFRMTKGGKLDRKAIRGRDHQHALDAVRRGLSRRPELGGKPRRPERPDQALQRQSAACWSNGSRTAAGADFLAQDAAIALQYQRLHRQITDPSFTALSDEATGGRRSRRCVRCWRRKAWRCDIAGYRAAPPGLRIWCGATVDKADIEALTPWLDWAWSQDQGLNFSNQGDLPCCSSRKMNWKRRWSQAVKNPPSAPDFYRLLLESDLLVMGSCGRPGRCAGTIFPGARRAA